MPTPVRLKALPFSTNLTGEREAKSLHPNTNCLPQGHLVMADILMPFGYNPTFMQYIFNLTETKRVTNVIHHGQSDNFVGCLKVFERIFLRHPQIIPFHNLVPKLI